MIVDRIENANLYTSLSLRASMGLEFIRYVNASSFYEHREAIDGEDVYAVFEEYETQLPDGRLFETHERYLDIQCVVDGKERINVAKRNQLDVRIPYDRDGDITWYDQGDAMELVLHPGCFAILFPHEAHLPRGAVGEPSLVKKVVVKVRL